MRSPVLLLLTLALPAQAETHVFCWMGANGYRIEGSLTYPDGTTGRITEDDVTAFAIAGFRDDAFLGRWSLDDLTPQTSWTLSFDTDRLAFRMGGFRQNDTYQEWNADGTATDCGNPGFGFNGGNQAQDVCVDGVFIAESGIPPDTPLRIGPDPSNPCGPLPLSMGPRPRTHG